MMMLLRYILIILLIGVICYGIAVFFDVDRAISLKMTPMSDIIESYNTQKKSVARRIVIVMICESGICKDDTLKSLLNQSVKADDIIVETLHPERICPDIRSSKINICPMGSTPLRECDADTIIIMVENDRIYPYDFIAKSLND